MTTNVKFKELNICNFAHKINRKIGKKCNWQKPNIAASPTV